MVEGLEGYKRSQNKPEQGCRVKKQVGARGSRRVEYNTTGARQAGACSIGSGGGQAGGVLGQMGGRQVEYMYTVQVRGRRVEKRGTGGRQAGRIL